MLGQPADYVRAREEIEQIIDRPGQRRCTGLSDVVDSRSSDVRRAAVLLARSSTWLRLGIGDVDDPEALVAALEGALAPEGEVRVVDAGSGDGLEGGVPCRMPQRVHVLRPRERAHGAGLGGRLRGRRQARRHRRHQHSNPAHRTTHGPTPLLGLPVPRRLRRVCGGARSSVMRAQPSRPSDTADLTRTSSRPRGRESSAGSAGCQAKKELDLFRSSSFLPITMRWISEVPSPIRSSGASR